MMQQPIVLHIPNDNKVRLYNVIYQPYGHAHGTLHLIKKKKKTVTEAENAFIHTTV